MDKLTQDKCGAEGDLPVPETIATLPLVTGMRTGEQTLTSSKPSEYGEDEPISIIEFHWKFAEETHQYVREQIRQADQKSVFFFAGVTAVIAFLYKAGLIHTWLKNPMHWVFTDVFSFIATVGLSVAAVSCAATVLPRLQGSKQGLVFFGAISAYMTTEAYATEVLKKTPREMIDAKLSHVNDLARICNAKYFVLRIGLWSGAIGVISTVLLLVFSK